MSKFISKKNLFLIVVFFIIIFFIVSSPDKYMGSRNIFIDNGLGDVLFNDKEDDSSEEEIVQEGELNPLTGVVCENALRRPIAVMLSGDAEARPLSGISKADIVIEMPVVTGGITRYMAIFGCDSPEEIGSVRSSRHDFISLAAGFGAIYAHWGGSHFALEKLDSGIIDNINALYLDGTVFYRKNGIVSPHDGFTSFENLENYSNKVGYSMENNFSSYDFSRKEEASIYEGKLTIGYPSIFEVVYEYNKDKNVYMRFKGGTREIDNNTNSQVEVKNIVVMYADSRQIEGQYNDVDVEGKGDALFFMNGKQFSGSWEKDASDISSKLYFFDDSSVEMKFLPGNTWIQIIEPTQEVDWTSGF